jgi:hypothetical protein
MPPSLSRGHTFLTNDVVTANDLNDLVRRATVSGLSSGDLGSVLGISIFSAASGASAGVMSYEYEPDGVVVGTGYSQVKYLIHQKSGAQVAIFMPGGLETRRFASRTPSLARGSAWLASIFGSAGVTLVCDFTYSAGVARHDPIGSQTGTFSDSSPTNATGLLRLTMKGIGPARVVDAGDTIRKYYYLLNAATAQWQHSPGATNTSKVFALAMRPTDSGDIVAPAYFLGAPVWRS